MFHFFKNSNQNIQNQSKDQSKELSNQENKSNPFQKLFPKIDPYYIKIYKFRDGAKAIGSKPAKILTEKGEEKIEVLVSQTKHGTVLNIFGKLTGICYKEENLTSLKENEKLLVVEFPSNKIYYTYIELKPSIKGKILSQFKFLDE